MIGTKEIPHRKDLVEFNYAVAGHAGTLCDPDGELFIKPCTQQEIKFYESANADHPAFAELMPVYMGTLSLNDATDIASINEQLPVVADHISKHMKEEVVALAHSLHPKPIKSADNDTSAPWAPGKNRKIVTDTAIVLENSAYGFKRPNIMDCKLGIRLWADDAPAEKKARFDNISANSTHKDLGFRIAGMRVYRGTNDPSELDPEQYRKYDKDWGRKEVNKHNILESLSKFIFNPHAGVDDQTAREVAASFAEELRKVDDVLSKESSRMYSASLLFVVEGDGDALRDAVAKSKEADAAMAKRLGEKSSKIHSPGRSDIRVDSGIGMDEDGDSVLAAEDEYDDDEDDDDEANLPRVYSLRLIDFAHATWVPPKDHQTPDSDENVRLGVRKLIGLFDELSKERPSAS